MPVFIFTKFFHTLTHIQLPQTLDPHSNSKVSTRLHLPPICVKSRPHLVPPACLPSLATACTLRVGSLSPFTYPPKIQMFRYPTTVWKCFLLIASGMHSHLALNRKQCSVFLTTLSWQTVGTPFHFELP